MGEDIFNFVLSDISGIPSLPVFIGNYLLDLLSAFFPIFLILSSFVMVYTAFARGSGDWKATGQQLMPTAVSIGIIMGLLSMKTPYTSSDGGGLNGEFWKDVNSYTVVEMMNTFLGFGNIFADALTHKIIYGSIDVSESNGNNDFNGYFPAVLEAMIEKDKKVKKEVVDVLSKNSNDMVYQNVESNYKDINSNTTTMINNLYFLGVIENHGKIRDGKENQVASYNNLNNKKYIDNAGPKVDEDGGILRYNTPAIMKSSSRDKGNIVNSSSDDAIENKYYNKKEVFLSHKNLLGEDNNEKSLIKFLNNFKDNDLTSITKEVTDKEIYSYLSPKNFQQEKLMIDNLEKLIETYSMMYLSYEKEMKNINQKIEATDRQEDKEAYYKKIEQYQDLKTSISGQLQSAARLHKDYVELYEGFSGKTINLERISDTLDQVKLSYEDDIKMDYAISIEEKEALRKSYRDAIQGEIPIKTQGYNLDRINSINNNLNSIMKSKAYITNVFFDKYKDILKSDSLLQYSLGFPATSAPFNLNFLNANGVNAVDVLIGKKKEIQKEYLHNGEINVSAKLKEAINKEQAGSDFQQGKIIHWTDLGKHYATFKNLYSPLITNIYAMEKMNSADIQGVASLIQMMDQLEPSEKTERLLFVANTFAAGKAVLGVSQAAMAGKTPAVTQKPDGGAFTSFWEAIKIIGGVYFAIFFVNVVLPAFVWMFAIITYYIEMSMYVAVFPIGFMFMIFQSYRQSLNQYINMLLGFILMPVILVSMYFVVLYIDMLMPMFFKQFMPFFASNKEFANSFNTAFGGQGEWLKSLMGNIVEGAGSFIQHEELNKAKMLTFGGGKESSIESDLMASIGNFIYTILSLLMSALLLMTFFRANEYMSKILNVSTVGGMDAFQGRETIGKFGSFDRSGMTAGIIGR